ncbi:LamG-like jellyroll fold domain-containing protein [Bdellovibrio sp. HCB185ZH]|uniref:LamG-like jellyroll fold domain-containing protein n=1 Tax=Bdellovibrio sp. HCB185ZH TaxID=3394235 RepID=UPI0039A528A1
MKWWGVVFLLLSTQSFAQTGMSLGMRGGASLRCQETSKSSWLPQGNNLIAAYHFNGSGTVLNGATIPNDVAGGPTATASVASSTLTYNAHAALPSTLAYLRNYLSTTGASNDIISSSGFANLTAGTWNFWVNMALPTGTAQRLFYKSNNGTTAGYYLTIDTSNTLKFQKVYSLTNASVQTCPLATSFANTWRMITITWDGTLTSTAIKIYMNGFELVTTGTGSVFLASPGSCTGASSNGGYSAVTTGLGTSGDDSAYPFYLTGQAVNTATTPTSTAFVGSMDEFSVWDKALTAAEIALLYRNQKCN